jgi:choline dehydrogenase
MRVLLLEAGKTDNKLEMCVPAAFPKLFKTEADWAFYAEPQSCMNHRQLYWPRGRVLGGSSSINAMIYIRGNPRAYDDWKVRGWRYQDVLPYFS